MEQPDKDFTTEAMSTERGPERVTEDVYWGDTIPTDGTWEVKFSLTSEWTTVVAYAPRLPYIARPKPVMVEVPLDLLRKASKCASEVMQAERGTFLALDTFNALRDLIEQAEAQ